MQFNFFATEDDLLQLWHWVFETPGMRLLQDYSEPDQPNRWFATWTEVENVFAAGRRDVTAWASNAGGQPVPQSIIFDRETQRKLNAKGRTILHSPAFIQYFWVGEQKGCLGASSLSCWSEKGARQRSMLSAEMLDQVDWKQLRSAITKVQRQIKKTASFKLYSAPIMPDAYHKLRDGQIKLWGWGTEIPAQSPLLQPI
jgi:hypothetical protein